MENENREVYTVLVKDFGPTYIRKKNYLAGPLVKCLETLNSEIKKNKFIIGEFITNGNYDESGFGSSLDGEAYFVRSMTRVENNIAGKWLGFDYEVKSDDIRIVGHFEPMGDHKDEIIERILSGKYLFGLRGVCDCKIIDGNEVREMITLCTIDFLDTEIDYAKKWLDEKLIKNPKLFEDWLKDGESE